MPVESTGSGGGIPLWVAVYLAAYIAFSLWSYWDDLAKKNFGRWEAVEAVGNVSLITAAICYWHYPFGELLGRWAVVLFALGVFSLIGFTAHKAVATQRDVTATPKERVGFSVAGAAFLLLLNAPLLWGGFQLVRAWAFA